MATENTTTTVGTPDFYGPESHELVPLLFVDLHNSNIYLSDAVKQLRYGRIGDDTAAADNTAMSIDFAKAQLDVLYEVIGRQAELIDTIHRELNLPNLDFTKSIGLLEQRKLTTNQAEV